MYSSVEGRGGGEPLEKGTRRRGDESHSGAS